MSSRKRKKMIKENLNAIPTVTLQELYEANLIPENYSIDDGDNGDVGNYTVKCLGPRPGGWRYG